MENAKGNGTENYSRDHLFISYATEDYQLAEWLTLKLTSEGYLVWCDRFKLLGGESYPINIDDAIKFQTFRVLSLLSRNSLRKPNPLKERELALKLGNERKEEFLIPLRVDNLTPTELDWRTTDITFIDFFKSWSEGFKQLLKKLQSIDAPKPLYNGKEIVAQVFLDNKIISKSKEKLYTNCFAVESIPENIKEFKADYSLENYEQFLLGEAWPYYKIDDKRFLAFDAPPSSEDVIVEWSLVNQYKWKTLQEINGIKVSNIIKSILFRSLEVKCLEKGLIRYKEQVLIPKSDRKKWKSIRIYFPDKLLINNKISFTGYKNKKTTVQVIGRIKRTFIGKLPEHFLYSLSPKFTVKEGLFGDFVMQLNIYLHITDESWIAHKGRGLNARRKNLCKSWWNNHWLNRVMAIASFLSDNDKIRINKQEDCQILISAQPIKFEAPFGINESISTHKLDKESREELLKAFEDPDDNFGEVEEESAEEEEVQNDS